MFGAANSSQKHGSMQAKLWAVLCVQARPCMHMTCACVLRRVSVLSTTSVFSRSWKLYKTKPKLHVQQEIQCLWQPSLFQLWTNHLLSLLAELPQPRELVHQWPNQKWRRICVQPEPLLACEFLSVSMHVCVCVSVADSQVLQHGKTKTG